MVYQSPDDAAEAMTHLNGFHLMERYIVGELFCLPSGLVEADLGFLFPSLSLPLTFTDGM